MNALARYERGDVVRADGNVVQFAAGGVAADVRVERVDRRKGASWYAVRLASTDADVTGRLLGVDRNGDITDLGGVAVAPGSIGCARLAVVTPRAGAYRSMFLEIRSDDVLVRVDAPVPPPRPGIRPWKAGAALVAFGAVATCGGLVALALPRDPMLGAPARAVAGTQVRLPYAAGGDGLAEYSATSDDGRVLVAGNLTRRNGEIAFALPASAASHRVSVALLVHGPLGIVSRTASFAVASPEPAVATAAVARVMSFSARRDAGPAGDTVLASYLAIGERGTIALLDAAGKVVASAPFAHVGTNRLPVPRAYQAEPMTARITVHRGATVADASVAIAPGALPQPSASPDASAADAPEAVTPLDAMSARTSGGTIAIVGRAVAGHPLKLHVAASSSPMQVELQDETGGTLAEAAIAPRASTAVLPLPAATATTTYFVALHYARNGGEETVVRTVVAATR
ncbi:MAG: hypothetical protein QOF71_3412 [Candidatus Eremiobacteraeota bacterium]|jgi:hypothetical protein|nr:hypothetical protein [Candidatus Eremiobacteraeota bacterium]